MRSRSPIALAACITSLALASCAAGLASSAVAASRPSLAPVGLPIGKIVSQRLPYTEAGGTAELSVTYKGSLPHGAKLQLLVKKTSVSPYKPSKTPVKLVGGHAKVHVTEKPPGGPILYEVAVISGNKQLSVSKPATIYWAQPPGGIFVTDGSEFAYTSLKVAHENCESGCKGDASAGEDGTFSVYSGSFPMPPGWKETLIYNGEVECTTESIEGKCSKPLAFPAVTAETVVPIVGELTSPTGKVTKATLLVTVYP
ncbi:MAG TPA: hypothetical protein VGF95_15370 [Solirubrobacteraceae bacterium]